MSHFGRALPHEYDGNIIPALPFWKELSPASATGLTFAACVLIAFFDTAFFEILFLNCRFRRASTIKEATLLLI